jgi:hypothetical protein
VPAQSPEPDRLLHVRAHGRAGARAGGHRRRQGRGQRRDLVVVGDEVVAFAEVDYELYPQGIQTTSLELFAADEADAKRIAERVNAGVEAR